MRSTKKEKGKIVCSKKIYSFEKHGREILVCIKYWKEKKNKLFEMDFFKKKRLFLYGLGLGWESQIILEPPNQSSSSSSPSF